VLSGYPVSGIPALSSVTSSSTLATVTTAAAHNFQTGQVVTLAGFVPAAYNGTYSITVTGATTFTYTMASSPGAVTTMGAYQAQLPSFLQPGSGLAVNLLATASPLILTTANGFGTTGAVDTITEITADVPSAWYGLPASSPLIYLFVGTANPASPTYAWTTAQLTYGPVAPTPVMGSWWFDTNAMQMKEGNGSTWVASQYICIGEAVTGASSVTSVTPYAFQGSYVGAWTNTLPGVGTLITANDNIGCNLKDAVLEIQCLTSEQNYSVGDIVIPYTQTSSNYFAPFSLTKRRNSTLATTGNGWAFNVENLASGVTGNATLADWAYRIRAKRSF
jgi:hypothetical protein